MAKAPSYYTRGKIEVWDFIRDQQLNFHLGNAIKYICRAGEKEIEGHSLQYAYIKDLTKAIHYLQNELLHATGGGIPNEVQNTQQQIESYDTEEFDR